MEVKTTFYTSFLIQIYIKLCIDYLKKNWFKNYILYFKIVLKTMKLTMIKKEEFHVSVLKIHFPLI